MDEDKTPNKAEESKLKPAQKQSGGIQAGRIDADNVVQGYQQRGGDLSQAAEVVILAKALSHGRITADSIQAQNVVSGFQYIADPNRATPDELRQEIARLRQELAEAVAASQAADDADLQDVQTALAEAEKELAEAEPHGRRIIRRLKTAADILTETVETAEAAHKLGQTLLKLAPAAAVLYQIAQKLFGG